MDLLCNEEMPYPCTNESAASSYSELENNTSETCNHHVNIIEGDGVNLAHILVKELDYTPKDNYAAGLQARGMAHWRSRSVSWLRRAQSVLGFQPQTFALAVNYLDRYLDATCSSKEWKGWMFELLSVACFSLAAKMEEVYVPSLLDLQMAVDATDMEESVYDPKIVQRMELHLGSALGWRLQAPTPFTFAEEAIVLLNLPLNTSLLPRVSALLTDLLTTEAEFVGVRPSLVASVAIMWGLEEDEEEEIESTKAVLLKAFLIDEASFGELWQVMEERGAKLSNVTFPWSCWCCTNTPLSPLSVLEPSPSCALPCDSTMSTLDLSWLLCTEQTADAQKGGSSINTCKTRKRKAQHCPLAAVCSLTN